MIPLRPSTARPIQLVAHRRGPLRRHGSRLASHAADHSPAATPRSSDFVKIVEVGPRDGLQNEKAVIPPATKVELINRLARAGMRTIEVGSFVSPKWVPQMAGTADVVRQMDLHPGVTYQALVPNAHGLSAALPFLPSSAGSSAPARLTEVSIFTAATDAFSLANTNATVAASLARLAPVARAALDAGARVRGYVSVAVACPYSGAVDPARVRDVTRALLEMGCYEVSLGDTTGEGTPATVSRMLEAVLARCPVDKLAGHFHDTFGMGVANALAALSLGLRTLDASVGGLGGCPYSPGATGNVATEDILYALRGSRYTAAGDLERLVETGRWISEVLGRENASLVGRALTARKRREEEKQKEREREREKEGGKARL